MNFKIAQLFRYLTVVVMLALSHLTNALTFELPKSIYELSPNKHARINQAAYKQLENAIKQSESGANQEALDSLMGILIKYPKNPYVSSVSLRTAIQILLQNDMYDESVEILELLLKLNSLSEQSLLEQRHNLAKLMFHLERFDKAISHMEIWMKSVDKTNVKAEDYYLLALAWYEKDNCEKAIYSAQSGLTKLNKANESLLRLVLGCHLENKHYQQAEAPLKQLIKLAPDNKSYWTQWVSIQQILNKPSQALAAMEVMEKKQWLSLEKQKIAFVHLLLQQNNPERAASFLGTSMQNKLVEKTQENISLLAHAWQQAGHLENAIATLEEIPPLQQNARMFQHLLSLFIETENWKSLITHIETRYGKRPSNWVTKSFVEKDINNLVQLGMAYYETGQITQAKVLFENLEQAQIRSSNKSLQKTTNQWRVYLNNFSEIKTQ